MLIRSKRNTYWRTRFYFGFTSCIVILSLYYILKIELFENGNDKSYARKKTYISKYTILQEQLKSDKTRLKYGQFHDFQRNQQLDELTRQQCRRFQDCFNFQRCLSNGFYIYIYPELDNEHCSDMYKHYLQILKRSHYATENPRKACLFISSVDTMDRDPLSQNFVKNLDSKMSNLEFWNNGDNHIVFNLFSGTWGNYVDSELFFGYNKAFLLKASFSYESIRQNIDISIPLIPSNHPVTLTNVKQQLNGSISTLSVHKNIDLFPVRRKYLLAFKGKRYLFGVGSETRNMVHLLHNDKDIILVTTCKHGSQWEKFKDSRCDEDNEKYDRYNYIDLLHNSTFCLVPRGRRLGSFRFLEAMEYGCIPVLLSNGWDLPFAEVLDWSRFSLTFDEELLLQIPSYLRSISDDVILAMKQQSLFVWHAYFESIEKMLHTSLEIIKARIFPDLHRPYIVWNHPPGALVIDPAFTTAPVKLPFYYHLFNVTPQSKFTAMILAVTAVYRSSSSLFKLIKAINLSEHLDQILVIWLSTADIPDKVKWPQTRVTLRVVHPPTKDMNARFVSMDLVNTDAVFTFDEDVVINSSEIDFAFSVWLSNPSQLVGFQTATHYYDKDVKPPLWVYTSKQLNEFSMVQTSAAVYHRYYNHAYMSHSPKGMHALIERSKTCESLAMNFVISSISNKAPIKIARSLSFYGGNVIKERLGLTFTYVDLHEIHQRCFEELVAIFTYLPLKFSSVSINPVLFKDPVSITRKKYRMLE